MDHEPTILIVDDEHHIRHVLSWKLSQAGMHVLVASNGAEGLEVALQHRPDLIISDYQMPVLDGLDLCKELANRHETEEIPIILLTGRGHRVDAIVLAQTSVQHVMSKPFSPNELIDRVKSMLPISPEGETEQDPGSMAA